MCTVKKVPKKSRSILGIITIHLITLSDCQPKRNDREMAADISRSPGKGDWRQAATKAVTVCVPLMNFPRVRTSSLPLSTGTTQSRLAPWHTVSSVQDLCCGSITISGQKPTTDYSSERNISLLHKNMAVPQKRASPLLTTPSRLSPLPSKTVSRKDSTCWSSLSLPTVQDFIKGIRSDASTAGGHPESLSLSSRTSIFCPQPLQSPPFLLVLPYDGLRRLHALSIDGHLPCRHFSSFFHHADLGWVRAMPSACCRHKDDGGRN